MSILIAYASKTGSTKKCAEMLAQKLQDVTLINLEEQDAEVAEYDVIIVGGSIRMGTLHNKVKKWIQKNKDALKTKKTAYFICCGFVNSWEQYFKNSIEKELLESAVTYDTFGGEMDLSKQKGLDKVVVTLVSKTEEGKKGARILEENVEKFVDNLKKVIYEKR